MIDNAKVVDMPTGATKFEIDRDECLVIDRQPDQYLSGDGEVVLCLWRGEFVVWSVKADTNDFVNGYYTCNIKSAVHEFNRRQGL